MLTYILIGVPTILILRLFLTSKPKPINGVYSQPDSWYWIKYWTFYCLFTLRKRQNQKQSKVSGQNAGYGMRSRSTVAEMEKCQTLPKEHPLAVDAVYFNGGNKDGYYFVGATARRHDKLTQTLLYLRVPGVGLLQLPTLPDTCLYREEELEYAANGFKVEGIEPMTKWRLSYDGKMKLIVPDTEESKELHVKFSLDWEAYTKYFDFDTDLDVWSMCGSMAIEQWSREFFDSLKKAHQTHYEQFGEITGTVEIEGHDDVQLKVQGVRDHSYGNIRDWSHLYRYGIQYFHLEDGSCGCIGNICMPLTMTRLIIGYIFHRDGTMDTVSSTDFELHKIGEDGNCPLDFNFSFVAGSKTYHLKGHVLDRPKFYMGYDWEARIHERMVQYEINGVKGWGISEWDFRNKTGRPDIYPPKRT